MSYLDELLSSIPELTEPQNLFILKLAKGIHLTSSQLTAIRDKCNELFKNQSREDLVAEAKAELAKAHIIDAPVPTESHCDQCDLQGVCCYLHLPDCRDCKAYPRIYRSPMENNCRSVGRLWAWHNYLFEERRCTLDRVHFEDCLWKFEYTLPNGKKDCMQFTLTFVENYEALKAQVTLNLTRLNNDYHNPKS